MAKRRKINTFPIYSEDMHSCMQWCINNRIKIYVVVINKTDFHVEVNNRGKVEVSEQSYSITDACTKVWELYCHMYRINNCTR